MTWLLPWALGAAAAAALVAGLLHLLARDRPPRWLLPTARFVAAGHASATRRARTPRDRLLLVVRMLALLLAGTAFAGPLVQPDGGSVTEVVVLDRTVPASRAAALDSARTRLGAGDRLVVVDATARVVAEGREHEVVDSMARADDARAGASALRGSAARADTATADTPTMSAAIVAAVRAASAVAPSADSVALTIVSDAPHSDAALGSVRALWPGRATVVSTGRGDADSILRRVPMVRGTASDAVVAGARLAGARMVTGSGGVRGRGGDAGDALGSQAVARGSALLVRGSPTHDDSAFAARGGALLVWPPRAPGADTVDDPGDAVGGFVVSDAAVVYRAARSHAPPAGRAIARWIDGAPAVTETPHGAGCIRTAAIGIPSAGDLTLRPPFQEALGRLLAPCGGASARPAMRDSVRALLAGSGPLAPAQVMRATVMRSPATPWLLAAALLLLLVEPLLRRPRRAPTAAP